MEPREKAAQLPESPGVYLFKDAGEKILYVGKARNLRSRVRSYFLESRWIDAKTGSLAREIADLETIVVGNEREALALEHNLIKQYRPKFNVVLRDDKTYPYIKFTAAEKYPRVYFTRRIKKDGSLYFGPYLPAPSILRVATRGLACSTTSSGALAPVSRGSRRTSATRKPRAMCGYFSKGAATI